EDHVYVVRLTRVEVYDASGKEVVFNDIRLNDADVEDPVVALHPVEVAELRHLGLRRLGLDRCLRLGLLSGRRRRDVDGRLLVRSVHLTGVLSHRAPGEGQGGESPDSELPDQLSSYVSVSR